MMTKKPSTYRWSKFYWDDWGNDHVLQSCDMATQGLWINLLRLMFFSERPGYLQINNQAMTILDIAKRTGFDKRTIEKKLAILIEKKVCSVDENNIIYSRRMAREEQERLKQNLQIQDNSKLPSVNTYEAHNLPAASTPDASMHTSSYASLRASLQEETLENRQNKDLLYTDTESESDINISSNDDINYISPSSESEHRSSQVQKRGSRLSEAWQPSDKNREYARKLGLDVDRVIKDFKGYWITKPGKNARKLDWSRTWEMWCRRAKDWQKPTYKPSNIHPFPNQKQREKSHSLDWMVEEHQQQWGGLS